MNALNIRGLASAVIMQAVRDYFRRPEKEQKVILKDLRSAWMDLFTDGMSIVVAEQLEKRPKEIKEKVRRAILQKELIAHIKNSDCESKYKQALISKIQYGGI